MKFNKDDIYGITGTVIFHLITLLILGFTVLKTVIPEEESGILVNFGNLDMATGTFEPRYTGEVLPQNTTPTPTPRTETAEEDIVTQDMEESVSLAEEHKKEEERKEERRRKEEEERRRLAEEQRRREEAISNRVAGAFGMGSTDEKSQGDTEDGAANQGNPFGNTDHGATEDTGGYGSFNLKGRTIGVGGLPRPTYNAQEEGRIVINITVDPKGNVIFANIGRGTNIDNAPLRKSALEAVYRAKFNSINGTNNQSGTITYRYSLR